MGRVVCVESVFGLVWPGLSDSEQELRGPWAPSQGLPRPWSAEKTLLYSCVPWLVSFPISPSCSSVSVSMFFYCATALSIVFFIVFVIIFVLWLSTAYFFLIQKSLYMSIHTLLPNLKNVTSYILFLSLLHAGRWVRALWGCWWDLATSLYLFSLDLCNSMTSSHCWQ